MKSLSKNEWIGIIAGIIVVALFFIFPKLLPIKKGGADQVNTDQTSQTNQISKVQIQEQKIGTGSEAKNGDSVLIDYTGMLTNGTKFDSSIGRAPLPFVLGAHQVVPGFEQGVLGMKVGGKRRITIPPELAYGSRAIGPIPANSTLIFDIELVKVVSAK